MHAEVRPRCAAQTTLFTIQNTTAVPQIARVTLWTDWAYPLLTFNVFLTGYDVQGINLYDVFARGAFPGTSNAAAPGPLSYANDQNPHFLPDAAATCGSIPAPPWWMDPSCRRRAPRATSPDGSI